VPRIPTSIRCSEVAPGSTVVNTNLHNLGWNFHFAFTAANQDILICFDDTSQKPPTLRVEFQFNPLVVAFRVPPVSGEVILSYVSARFGHNRITPARLLAGLSELASTQLRVPEVSGWAHKSGGIPQV
jgi:hypothetical protein